MTLSEAKMILEMEGNDSEEARDRYEELVFQMIQLFLKDPVIPSLCISRLDKLRHLSEAYSFFNENKSLRKMIFPEMKSLEDRTNWKDLFLSHEQNKAELRREISRTYDYSELNSLVQSLTEGELKYANVLVSKTVAIPSDTNVKISEVVPVIQIIKECENLMDSGVLDESLDSLSKLSDKNVTFNFSKEVNRLRKIVKNG